MKKWLNDLYAILMKRGFNTLDNVLKKYKTEIEDYEEIKLNDELITLNPNDSITFNLNELSKNFNVYDRFSFYNRGPEAKWWNFIVKYYKYSSNYVTQYYKSNLSDTSFKVDTINENVVVTNLSGDTITFNLYVKKLC